MQLVVATTNDHKLGEIRDLIPDSFKISSLSDIGFNKEIIEDGSTFTENAQIKARTVYKDINLNCLADDSGIEVEALNGAPGIYSARFAGESASDDDNLQKLISDMRGIENRKARYVCVIVLIINGKEYLFEGEIKGTLREEPQGENGFGYDPIFMPEGYNLTFGQLSPTIKAEISHRAKAMQLLVTFLANF